MLNKDWNALTGSSTNNCLSLLKLISNYENLKLHFFDSTEYVNEIVSIYYKNQIEVKDLNGNSERKILFV